jgi:hypothetical protein
MSRESSVRDIMHFFGIEEENVIKNIANFGEDFFLVHNLDLLYRKCMELKPIDKPELKIPAFLFLNSHREFYLGVNNFFRLHQSKTFCNLRSALDSAFTAYYLLKHPDRIKIYLSTITEEPSKEWKKLFSNIKETVKKDIKNFPHAEGLPKMHEFCSIHSHSDALGIMNRYKLDKDRLVLLADYFDYEDSLENYKKWFGAFQYGFFRVFLIFWREMFEQRAGDDLQTIIKNISIYKEKLQLFRQKYPLK